MTAFPFSRTRSESSFSFGKVTSKENNRHSPPLQQLLYDKPESLSNDLYNNSSTFLFKSAARTGRQNSQGDLSPFTQPNSRNNSQRFDSSNVSTLDANTPFPVFRSQSATLGEFSSFSTPHQNQALQHMNALRRPPASFSSTSSNEPRVSFSKDFKPPQSGLDRANSEGYADLWKELERLNLDVVENDQDEGFLKYNNIRSSSNGVPLFSKEPKEYGRGTQAELVNKHYLNYPKSYSKDNYKESKSSQAKGYLDANSPSYPSKPLSYNLSSNSYLSEKGHGNSQEPSNMKSNRSRNITPGNSRANVPCRFFMGGHCSKGSSCQFYHPVPGANAQTTEAAHRYNLDISSMSFKIGHDGGQLLEPAFNPNSNDFVASRKLSESEKATLKPSDNRYAHADFSEFLGNLTSLCQDQVGCRYLQKTLEEGNSVFISAIYKEITPYMGILMKDPFGNYLSQKLVECAKSSQRIQLLQVVSKDLAQISFNSHGTRATQKIIELLAQASDFESDEAIKVLTEALDPHVVSLIKDSNGNHVIQKCISLFPCQHTQFIYDAISRNCVSVATHKHGCCIIQRCFDNASSHQKDQLAIVIAANALSLVQDPYGNYVVQCVIGIESCNYTKGLILNFLGHVPRLSTQKFSSNVIEKCIQAADIFLRRQLIGEIVGSRDLEHLLQDSYANYVIQTCLEFAEPVQREELLDRIKPILLTAQSSPFTKRIMARISSEDGAHNKVQDVPSLPNSRKQSSSHQSLVSSHENWLAESEMLPREPFVEHQKA